MITIIYWVAALLMIHIGALPAAVIVPVLLISAFMMLLDYTIVTAFARALDRI